MSADSNLAGAVAPMVFADGAELRLAPLTDRDIAEIDEWMRSQVVRSAVQGCADMDEKTQEKVIKIAVREAAGVSLMNGSGARQIATIDGITRLVWQMARREHPDVKIDEVRKHMFDPANVRESFRLFNQLNRVDIPEAKPNADEPKKGSRRKRMSIVRSQTSRAGRSTR